MIRFIDIRNQGTGNRFAFWDTIYNRFVCFDGEYAWTNWNEFYTALSDTACGCFKNKIISDYELRFRGLCPPWVFDNEEDDLEKFYDAGE